MLHYPIISLMDNWPYQDVTHQAPHGIVVPLDSPVPQSQESTISHNLEVPSATTTPRQVLSKGQWEELRPVISRLYIDENKTFKAVAEVLRESHNFVPTCVYFKTPIGLHNHIVNQC